MKKTLCAATLTLMALPAWSQQPPSDATVEAHVNAATRAAGKDLESLLVLCKPAPVARPPQALVDKGIAAQIARPAPPPGQAFDNLYFVGAAWATAWALTTPEGIVIFDPLNNEQEAVTLIEGGLRKLGLDPSRISHLVVSHGHGDHYGGAQYLIGKYKPRVVMSDLDWTMTGTKLEFSSVHWGPPPTRDPTRDLAVKDGDLLTLGGAPILFPLTPGHTWGTVSPVFDVTWKGTKHRVMIWGGTAFNFGKDIPRMDAYIGGTRRMAALAKEQGVDVMISNHAAYDGAIAKTEALRKDPGGANPFVMGTASVVRALNVMEECALAQKDRYLLQP
jgi:metallo-beta-lactamase class B